VTSCPICHRFGWFTDQAVAEHVERDHPGAVHACDGRRVRYRTSDDALDALISTARKPREKRREHRRYPCSSCGGYHLTSKPLPEGQTA